MLSTKFKRALLAGCVSLAAVAWVVPAYAAFQSEIFGLQNDNIMRVDLSTNTVQNTGYGGVGFTTNLAMAPDRTLYYMNPFGGAGGHDLYKNTLDGSNNLVGPPILVTTLPTAGFGIIDGFTIGPDGNLYMTGYGKSEIYRYNIVANTFSVVVTLTANQGNEFRSDLAFDPVTNNLVGLGYRPGDQAPALFEIPNALAMGTNGSYNWTYFHGNASPWAAAISGLPADGIAFDPTNGSLYLSSDADGIYQYDPLTAALLGQVPGTTGIGWDLAFQTREVSINDAPEPGSLALVGLAIAGLAASRRKLTTAKEATPN